MYHYNIWPPWKKDYSLEKSYFITKSPCIYHNTKTPSISDGVWRRVCQDNSGTFPSEVIYCIFLVEDWIT